MTPSTLAAWRGHMGYTQRAAAAALGVALPTYQRLERGAAWADGAEVMAQKNFVPALPNPVALPYRIR